MALQALGVDIWCSMASKLCDIWHGGVFLECGTGNAKMSSRFKLHRLH